MKQKTLVMGGIILLLVAITHVGSSAQSAQSARPEKVIESKTILFVTGAFVSNRGWDEWRTYFESKGYTTYAPAWPHKDGVPEDLRKKHPDKELAALSLEEVVDYYESFAKGLPEKPILVGHSLGGLIAQLLLQREAGVAAVAYHSVPPKGTLSFKFSFVKSLTPPYGLFKSAKKPYLMSFKHWQYTFTNGMTLEEQKVAYHNSTIPESRRAIRDGLGKTAKVNFKKAHGPLLFVSGSEDNIMPASLNYKIYKKYKKHSNSITDYKKFMGRNHYAMGQSMWKEDADFIIDWINSDPATLTSLKK